jgi:hypothetical protein
LSFGLIALLGLIAGCGYIPRAVEGVPPGDPWQALPLRKWLAEDRAEPHAISFCAPPECRPGLVVGVIDLTGRDANITEAILRDPSRLTRAFASPVREDRTVGTIASAHIIREGDFRGFAMSLASREDGKRPAYAAALGQRREERLRVILVIGEDETSVRITLGDVARAELRS